MNDARAKAFGDLDAIVATAVVCDDDFAFDVAVLRNASWALRMQCSSVSPSLRQGITIESSIGPVGSVCIASLCAGARSRRRKKWVPVRGRVSDETGFGAVECAREQTATTNV